MQAYGLSLLSEFEVEDTMPPATCYVIKINENLLIPAHCHLISFNSYKNKQYFNLRHKSNETSKHGSFYTVAYVGIHIYYCRINSIC